MTLLRGNAPVACGPVDLGRASLRPTLLSSQHEQVGAHLCELLYGDAPHAIGAGGEDESLAGQVLSGAAASVSRMTFVPSLSMTQILLE